MILIRNYRVLVKIQISGFHINLLNLNLLDVSGLEMETHSSQPFSLRG